MDKLVLAGCVILNDKNQLVLMHRNTPKRVQWETPGGKIEEGENPDKAAIRELKEELGVDIKIIKKLGQKEFSEDGFIMEYVWFLAKIVSGEPKLMEAKFDDLRYFFWEELRKMTNELSPNTKNLLAEYSAGRITLND